MLQKLECILQSTLNVGPTEMQDRNRDAKVQETKHIKQCPKKIQENSFEKFTVTAAFRGAS